MERSFKNVKITPKGERALRSGHPWVYADEITAQSAPIENGELTDVFSSKDKYLGTGFYNENSKIRVRLLSRNTNDRFDEAFFDRRIRYAVEYRKQVMGSDFHCCRLIFGEADMLPGLTVDLFENILVAEVLCLGIDQRKEILFRSLVSVLKENGIDVQAVYERNDSPLRDKEGLEKYCSFYPLDGLKTDLNGHVILSENGILYDVDYIRGQKTGFFLDQKYNRLAAAKLAEGKNVLDCFTHTGAFALNCVRGGAAHVTAVDISAEAIELTKQNAERNGYTEKMDFITADVFDYLTELSEKKSHPYDFIILDPPAFTKSSSTVKNAARGYKEINMKAMRLLPRGGYLATCSCSHFMTDELFQKILDEAALDASVQLRQIEARQQAPDHPILRNVPETAYLKFYLFQVV